MNVQGLTNLDISSPCLSSTFKQAVALGIEAVVRHHLRSGQDVNSRDDKGQTPLIIAAAKGHAKICSILLEAGANPSLKDSAGYTALDVAINQKRSDVWELLQRQSTVEPPVPQKPKPSAPAPVPPQVPKAAPVIVLVLDEKDVALDLSGWQSEVDLPPPPQDPLVLPDVGSTQRKLGDYIPIDLDEDWSDVEITLPELIARRRRRQDNEEETRWLGDASALVLTALRDGEVSESLIEGITPAMGIDGDDEGVVDYDAMLRMTLGDLGVRVGDDEDSRIIFDGPDDESEERYDQEISEAMQFLRTCLERREDPLTHYINAVSGIKVLSREDEQTIGRNIEEGVSMAFSAIASSGVAMKIVTETLSQIEQGQVEWNEVIADEPAYGNTNTISDDDQDGMPEEFGDNKVVDDAKLPGFLTERFTLVQDGYTTLKAAAPQHVVALTRELGTRIQALGLREEVVERLRSVVENKEIDHAIRKRLSTGLENTRVAKHRLFHCNQKLVFWVAKNHQNRGLPLMDLVQEGSLGLMKAVEKFDYSLGNKFSTYAIWWIRQAITRAIADQSRIIRVPVHVVEVVNKVRRVKQEYNILRGRKPTIKELAEKLEISEAKATQILLIPQDVVSLDEVDDTGNMLYDLLIGPAPSPEERILQQDCKDLIRKELSRIPLRQRIVICMRFGIGVENEHTLEEIGQKYCVSRERIRQIEAKAIRSFKYPARLRNLKALR